jgi:hypothetical protein
MPEESLYDIIKKIKNNIDLLANNEEFKLKFFKLLHELKLTKTFNDESAKTLQKDNILDSTPEKNYDRDDFPVNFL